MHYAEQTKFSWHKSPQCAQLGLVNCSVIETRAQRFFLHYCVTIVFTVYPWQKEKEKYPIYDIFSVLSLHVCRISPTKICISVSQLYQKLFIMYKKGRFHDTPVELVHNVHRFASCSIGRHVTLLSPYSTKAKTMMKSMVSGLYVSLYKGSRTKMGYSKTQL